MNSSSGTERPRIHVISLPHTETTRAYDWCAFTAKTRKFVSMMTNIGYEVFLYAGEANEASATEHIPIISRAEQQRWFGNYDWSRDMFNDFDTSKDFWRVTNLRAAQAIRSRAKRGDILGLVMGWPQQPVARMLSDVGMYEIEIGIGYTGTCAPFRVFESYALRHFLSERVPRDDVRPFDTVIPNFFELEAFPEGKGDGDYFLFLGRVVRRKGPHIAAAVCNRIGAKLVVAGQGVAQQSPDVIATDGTVLDGHVEYVGLVDPIRRASLLGGAKAVFAPTLYLEPFGGVAVEAMLCGTPVITTDWGAFTETVIDGVTGFRCNTISEFVDAARRVEELDRKLIRKYASDRFSTSVVAFQYDSYFKRVCKDYPTMKVEGEREKLLFLKGRRKLAESNPSHDIWLALSLDYYNAGCFQECVDAAHQALTCDPSSPEAYNNLSVGYRGLGEWEQSIKAAEQAIKLRPGFSLARNNLLATVNERDHLLGSRSGK